MFTGRSIGKYAILNFEKYLKTSLIYEGRYKTMREFSYLFAAHTPLQD